ncbi:MAG TPA: YDG domain-containing protein, partial [Rhodoferax sp.]
TGLVGANKVYNTTLVDALSGSAALTNGAASDTDGKYYSADTVGLTGTPAGAFADKNVGNAKTVAITGLGVDNTNYTVSHAATSADISKADLTVSGLTANNKVYDTTVAATLVGTANVAPLASDVVNMGGTGSGVFANPNVGTGIAVIVSGYTLNGTDADNYAIIQPTGLKADISAAPVVPVDPPAPPASPQQEPVISVPTQLASTVFSPRAETRPDALHLLPTITVFQSSTPEPVAEDSTSAPERSSNTVVNTMMTIGGGMGPSLQIVSGGMTLPTNMVNVNE